MKITNIWQQSTDPLSFRVEIDHKAIVYISSDPMFHLKTEHTNRDPRYKEFVRSRMHGIVRGEYGEIQPPFRHPPGKGGRRLGSKNKKKEPE